MFEMQPVEGVLRNPISAAYVAVTVLSFDETVRIGTKALIIRRQVCQYVTLAASPYV